VAYFRKRVYTKVKRKFEKIMTVRLKPDEHRMLSERSREVGTSFSRYLIECGLFECGLRRGILTPEDREVLQFLAFQVVRVGTNLNQIAKRLNSSSGTVDLSHLEAALTEIEELSGSLRWLIGEA
jgi:DNA-binding NarL/FixJ family response regulator